MSNPFTNIITAELKTLHKQMIDALLEDDALTVPCQLTYGATNFTDCPNCIFDSFGNKSSNKYQSGGPIPFYHGICPYCNGAGKISASSSETLYLMPIWDSKDWFKLSQNQVSMADISVQTMSKMPTYAQLIRCTSIQIDTNITQYGVPEFTRLGRPEPCGFGASTYIITSWKRT